MKKLMNISLLSFVALAACTTGHSKQVDFITEMYNDQLYTSPEWLEEHCTPTCLEQLREAYDYDCYTDACYAVWLFRTGAQDGMGESKILDVTKIGNGEYAYHFLDMGHEGINHIRLIETDHQLKIDDIKQVEAHYEY